MLLNDPSIIIIVIIIIIILASGVVRLLALLTWAVVETSEP